MLFCNNEIENDIATGDMR